jgi:hypothetical protein
MSNFATCFASDVDTGGKFANGVNDTSGKQWDQLTVGYRLFTSFYIFTTPSSTQGSDGSS